MSRRRAALAALLLAVGVLAPAAQAAAEPVVVASGAYPEGLLWHGGRMYFAEMGADRITVIENGATRPFWQGRNCGPTSIAPFGAAGFLVNCHLGHALIELSGTAAVGRRFGAAPSGPRIEWPNASVGDGQGGVYVSDSGLFSLQAPAAGRVYHLSAVGAMTDVIGQIRYANGVAFDRESRTLYVSEHLGRRILALTLDRAHRVVARRTFVEFAGHPATRDHAFALAGPDGLILRQGNLIAAEYGESRVHVFGRDGRWLRTVPVPMPFVDTVAFDAAGYLYAGGSFQISRPPFEGVVVKIAPKDWEPSP